MSGYIKLGVAALLPVAVSAVFFILENKTAFGKLKWMVRQVMYGLVFGVLAILGTEWGIPINGAQANCRDAAVLCAGLLFGAPAGIIAGLIGGIERWFAVLWGVGSFTRMACTVSTIVAGLYAAGLRRFMFDDKRPGVLISLAVGVVMETFHLTMVFITNMATPTEAMAVVRACTAPMLIANGVSVMLATLTVALLSHREARKKTAEQPPRISQTVQLWMLVAVMLAFLATSLFVYSMQNTIAETQTDILLELAVAEVAEDIRDTSDANLLGLARRAAAEIEGNDLDTIAAKYGFSEVSVIDSRGIIVNSTDPRFFNFNMASGEQSAEFLCLLDDRTEFVQSYQPMTYDKTSMRKYAGVRTAEGFIQVGYDAVNFQRDIDSSVVGITKNRHVGSTGYTLILDSYGNVVSAPEAFGEAVAADVGKLQKFSPETTFRVTLGEEELFCRYEITEGYRIAALYPVTEALQMRNIALYVNTFMEILVFAILFGLIYLLIKKVVVTRLQRVNGDLSRITEGDLDVVVDVRTNEEFSRLSDDINSTVGTLKRYIAEASARIDRELEFAKEIQLSALPGNFPQSPKFDIYALMDTAKEVGGDFYDFYLTSGDRVNFLIADVSGKGIPAAMFMMRSKTELRTLSEAELPLGEVFMRGNDALCEGNDADMFVSAWQGSVDLARGRLSFVNAGHNPPLIRRAGGQFELLRTKPGLVLAAVEGMVYRPETLDLEPGDTVFLYTDGVTEAQNSAEELFGEQRLLAIANAREYASVRELCESIKNEVDAFTGEAAQFDDITMIAFRYLGAE